MSEMCQERVYPKDQWGSFHPHPCRRKAWKDGFCKQHHPDTVKARQEASQKRWQEKRKKQSWYLLKIAQERIAELEAEVARLSDVNTPDEPRKSALLQAHQEARP